jgi:hypothetical protein
MSSPTATQHRTTPCRARPAECQRRAAQRGRPTQRPRTERRVARRACRRSGPDFGGRKRGRRPVSHCRGTRGPAATRAATAANHRTYGEAPAAGRRLRDGELTQEGGEPCDDVWGPRVVATTRCSWAGTTSTTRTDSAGYHRRPGHPLPRRRRIAQRSVGQSSACEPPRHGGQCQPGEFRKRERCSIRAATFAGRRYATDDSSEH